MEFTTALLLIVGLPLLLFAPGLAWSFVVVPSRPHEDPERLDPFLRGLLAFAGSIIPETLLLLAIHFLGGPINAWTAFATWLLLTAAPIALLLQRRAATTRPPSEAPPPKDPAPEPPPQGSESPQQASP